MSLVNRTLFCGDNLKIMSDFESESIDLIITDPPFNKSRNFHSTKDITNKKVSFVDIVSAISL